MPPKYKPGGRRFPAQSVTKPLPKQLASNSTDPEAAAFSRLDQEAENQFELELCWCIQQLEITLGNGKLNEKQSLDAAKTLNLLKNNAVALIRKRQAMRNTFGDYRAKMVAEEKKHGRYLSNFKFSATTSSDKSVFLKKAIQEGASGTIDDEKEANCKKSFIMTTEPPNEPFRFNFAVPETK